MEDTKAIDVQCRPFCFRPRELLKPISQTYEFKIIRWALFKGQVIKMGLEEAPSVKCHRGM
jgi:hypothetical protein